MDISIVVPVYNEEESLRELHEWIAKVLSSLSYRYEIIMVDNGGSTPSVGKYSEQPNTKVLHFPENLGFAGGNNKALDHAEGDCVLLMNQDVVVGEQGGYVVAEGTPEEVAMVEDSYTGQFLAEYLNGHP